MHLNDILAELKIDAYVGYDFNGSNPILRNMLNFRLATHRRFLVIVTQTDTHFLIPKLEETLFMSVIGEKHVYRTYSEFVELVKTLLTPYKTLALDIAHDNELPGMDLLPHGVYELIAVCVPNATLVSATTLSQYVSSIWSEEDYMSHKEAATILKNAADATWKYIQESLVQQKTITDYDAALYLDAYIKSRGCVTDEEVCDVSGGKDTGNPHYLPSAHQNRPIKSNSLLLFDIWAKKDIPGSIFADMTLMAWIGPDPIPQDIQKVWDTVRDARNAAIKFLEDNGENDIPAFMIDDACRQVITDAGYAEFFTHRTGHSIDTIVHGTGANFDNFETHDIRTVIPRTGYSIEPGIYLPEFGVRSEINVYMTKDKKCEVTTWLQEDLKVL